MFTHTCGFDQFAWLHTRSNPDLESSKTIIQGLDEVSFLSIAKNAHAAICLDHKTQLQELHKNCVN